MFRFLSYLGGSMTRRTVLLKTALSICLSCLAADVSYADENSLAYLSGLPDQAQMIAPASNTNAKATTYILPACYSAVGCL
jgi:hypothetical protein